MNEHEAQRIAGAVNVLRPDWPVPSLRSLLTKPELTSRPRRDVAVALVWVACETNTKTPARVLETGPWWKAVVVDEPEQTYTPPKSSEACDLCGRHEQSCICDVPTVDGTHRQDRPRGFSREAAVPPTSAYLEARAALHEELATARATEKPTPTYEPAPRMREAEPSEQREDVA